MIDFQTLLSYYVRKYRYAADSCDKKWKLNNMASHTVQKVGRPEPYVILKVYTYANKKISC